MTKRGDAVFLVGQLLDADDEATFYLVEAEVVGVVEDDVTVNTRPGCRHEVLATVPRERVYATREDAERRLGELERQSYRLEPSEHAGRLVFRCACAGCAHDCDAVPDAPCNRTQHYARADQGGGVTVGEAKSLGWRLTERGWLCPTCAGDDSSLREVFDKGRRR